MAPKTLTASCACCRPRLHQVEEPTVRMTFSVNTSPFAGQEGKFVTSRNLKVRRLAHRRTQGLGSSGSGAWSCCWMLLLYGSVHHSMRGNRQRCRRRRRPQLYTLRLHHQPIPLRPTSLRRTGWSVSWSATWRCGWSRARAPSRSRCRAAGELGPGQPGCGVQREGRVLRICWSARRSSARRVRGPGGASLRAAASWARRRSPRTCFCMAAREGVIGGAGGAIGVMRGAAERWRRHGRMGGGMGGRRRCLLACLLAGWRHSTKTRIPNRPPPPCPPRPRQTARCTWASSWRICGARATSLRCAQHPLLYTCQPLETSNIISSGALASHSPLQPFSAVDACTHPPAHPTARWAPPRSSPSVMRRAATGWSPWRRRWWRCAGFSVALPHEPAGHMLCLRAWQGCCTSTQYPQRCSTGRPPDRPAFPNPHMPALTPCFPPTPRPSPRCLRSMWARWWTSWASARRRWWT